METSTTDLTDQANENPDPQTDSGPDPFPTEPTPEPTPDPEPSEPEAAPADPAPTDAEDVEKSRRGRGDLEHDIKLVCDSFVTGTFVLPDGETLTPHRIGRRIKESDGLNEAPSTGAVAAALDRWVAIGFANVGGKPKAFIDYTDAGRTEGLAALKAKAKQAKSDAKAAAKAAEAAAQPAPTE